jgi:hypothetical protein
MTRCGSFRIARVLISIGRPGPTGSGASGALPFDPDEPDDPDSGVLDPDPLAGLETPAARAGR